MPTTSVYDSPQITVWYHPDSKIVHHECHGFVHGDPLRTALLKGSETLRRSGARKWLSDDRRNGALSPEDAEWAQTTWFPQTVAGGWKYWAIVLPEQAVGQMNIKRFAKAYADQGVTAQLFTDPADAEAWLKSV